MMLRQKRKVERRPAEGSEGRYRRGVFESNELSLAAEIQSRPDHVLAPLLINPTNRNHATQASSIYIVHTYI